MKPRRKFYSLSYPDAMRVAKQVASVSGQTDWKQYRDWMARYDEVQARRKDRAVAFHESLGQQSLF